MKTIITVLFFYNQETAEFESRNDLANILHSTIKRYNYIPRKLKHDKYKITRIIFMLF